MLELPAGWPEVLNAIIRGPGAWASVPQIAERIHTDEPPAAAWCRALEGDGWIAPWDWDGTEIWTLTVDAAARLNVHLEPDQVGDGEHWSGAPRTQTNFRLRQRHVSLTELIPDPAPGPDEIVSAGELIEARAATYAVAQIARGKPLDPDRLPKPTLLLTGSETVWSERRTVPGRAPAEPVYCPVCKLRPLPRIAYCLRCGRWGWDDYFAIKKRRAV